MIAAVPQQLSDWFNRSHYMHCHDPDYWRVMISCRLTLKHSIAVHGLTDYPYARRRPSSAFEEVVEKTTKLALQPDSPQANLYKALQALNEMDSVLPMRIVDLEHLKNWSSFSPDYQRAIKDINKYTNKWHPKLSDTRKDLKKSPPKGDRRKEFHVYDELRKCTITQFSSHENDFDSSGYLPVMVNPHKSVAEITRDIKKLKQTLTPSERLLSNQNKEFDKWHEYGVLPYFDLKHWSKLSGIRLTNKQIGELIWPSTEYLDLDADERIKKTTTRFVRKVISDSTLKTLR
jgi:hypothetical protein